MKSISRKFLSLFIISIILLTSIVACSQQEATSETESDVAETGDDEESESVESDPHRKFEGTTLRLLFKEGYDVEVIFAHKDEFEAATGIKLEIEQYDEPTTRQKFILNETARAGAYDIVPVSFWYFPEYEQQGWLEPLDSYIENMKDPEWYGLDNLPQSALDVFSKDGVRYGLPQTVISAMFMYRKDILEECNIEPPETTEDLIGIAPEVQECKPEMAAFTGRGAPTFASLGTYLGWAYGYGALLFDEEMRPQATSPEMVKAMEDLVGLYREYGVEDQATLTFLTMGDRAMADQVVMFYDTSGWGSIIENPDSSQTAGKWGYSLLKGPADEYLQWLYMEALAIPSDSQNKEAAWLFLQWRTSLDIMMKEMQDGRTDTPNLVVQASDEFQSKIEELGPSTVEYSNLLPESWNMATNEHWPSVKEFAEIGDIFAQEMSEAIVGNKDVITALEAIQSRLDELMQEAGYY